MALPRRKKFSSVFSRNILPDCDIVKLNRIYSLHLLSEEKKLSNHNNKFIDDIVLRYDCSERKLQVYGKRWVLFVLSLIAITISSMQFFQFCIISNTVQLHFNVSSDSIYLTSLLYMLIHFIFYVPLTFYICKNMASLLSIMASGETL